MFLSLLSLTFVVFGGTSTSTYHSSYSYVEGNNRSQSDINVSISSYQHEKLENTDYNVYESDFSK